MLSALAAVVAALIGAAGAKQFRPLPRLAVARRQRPRARAVRDLRAAGQRPCGRLAERVRVAVLGAAMDVGRSVPRGASGRWAYAARSVRGRSRVEVRVAPDFLGGPP